MKMIFSRRESMCLVKAVSQSTPHLVQRNFFEFGREMLSEDATIDWNAFVLAMGQLSSIEQGKTDLIDFSPDFSSGFLLHEAIKLRAPHDILTFISEKFPETLRTRNDDGAYTTHIACSVPWTSPEFVHRCINMSPESVSAVDSTGKTPIHHLCQSYNVVGNDRSGSTKKNMKQILWMIYRKGPGSVIVEDNRGVNAIEYALESNLGIDFIRLLHNMIARYHQNDDRKAAQGRRINARRGLEREASPHAAFAA